jgi:iron(III) transport system ATP-binding protein
MVASGDDRASARVEVKGVSRSFGRVRAVCDLNFTIEPGEFFSILGPSGCGKTTTLRLIAGLEQPDQGTIVIGDDVVAGGPCWVSPERRAVGIVFQDCALFPHLTVAQNVGFGLKGWSRQAMRLRVAELLALVGLEGLDARYPHELSGGQCQRVALARSLAPAPRVMLLDEPFSNLDAGLREELRTETRRILKERGTTTILVTHEQEEAFALSDRVGVLDRGCLQQIDTPEGLYREPATRFVAEFIGQADFLTGRAQGSCIATGLGCFDAPTPLPQDTPVQVMLRPEEVELSLASRSDPFGATVDLESSEGIIVARRYRGGMQLITVRLASGEALRSLQPAGSHFPLAAKVRLRATTRTPTVFLGNERVHGLF